MEYIFIAITLLFLPGLAIAYLLNLDRYRYLLSFSLSYALFVVLLKSMSIIKLDTGTFTYVYFFVIAILLILGVRKYYLSKYKPERSCSVKCCGCNGLANWTPGLIIFFVAVYFFYAGAYVELPADVFSHLEYMQEKSFQIYRSEKYDLPLKHDLGQNGKYWHYLYSFISIWGRVSLQDSILPASVFNTTVFLLGIYWFSQVVFKEMLPSSKMLTFASVAAVFFTFFHFGVNIFSFIRYYAIAPVILNFVLYFAVMAIVIDFYRDKEWNLKYLVVAGVIFFASLYIHHQEALLAILMVCIMSFYLFVQKHIPTAKLLWQGHGKSIQFSPVNFLTDKINISFLLVQTVMISICVYSFFSVSRHPVGQPKIMPLENIFPFFKNLYILNPAYQFYYVVALWGVVVILLFILNIRRFSNNAFLMAGMLSPFFTIFNPVFVDIFLRHSWTVLLWRMTLLVPLHLVAAYLFVVAIKYIWHAGYLKKLYGVTVVFTLIALLFPFQTRYIENTYSRLHTLRPVPTENSPEYWGDLIEFLNGIERRKRVITDPVTGYMITALTIHESARKKFHRAWGGYVEFNYDDYSSNPLDNHSDALFILNKRNGGISKTGRIARHWSEGILNIENYYYSKKLEAYLSSNPDRFRLLWEKDRVKVYLLLLPKK